MNELIFIILWAFQPASCSMPGCLVMHYDSPTHIEVCETIEDVNSKRLEANTKVYQYNLKTGELKPMMFEAITEKKEVEETIGWKIK